MRYLFLVLPFLMFGQTDIDLSNMTSNVLLGEPIGIVSNCDGSDNEVFNAVGDVRFLGHRIGMNNATLNIEGTLSFGGSFIGHCGSVVNIKGRVVNLDPADPGGNPFGNNQTAPNIRVFEDLDMSIELPDGVGTGWYEFIDLLQIELNRLAVENYNIKDNYTYKNSILTIENVNFIRVYNLLGQELQFVKGNSIKLKKNKEILIIKTDKGSFKIIK